MWYMIVIIPTFRFYLIDFQLNTDTPSKVCIFLP